MKRRRFDRFVRVQLECGCLADLHTGSYRVSATQKALVLGHAVRRGVWCLTCKGCCMPVKFVATVAGTAANGT
jgi:hypothetical protein